MGALRGGAAAGLRRRRDAGFTFAIDDFGAGYSSLSRLRTCPRTSSSRSRLPARRAGRPDGDRDPRSASCASRRRTAADVRSRASRPRSSWRCWSATASASSGLPALSRTSGPREDVRGADAAQGDRCPIARLVRYPSAADGRPQAEAVALAHEQAPLAAQDHRAGGERCPQCHQPRRPHRVCPHCGFYGGREVVADRARPRPRHDSSPSMTAEVTVAVDANGADLGPAEVARGAARSPPRRGVPRAPVRARPPRSATSPDGVEVVDAPVSIAKAADPARAVRATPDASIVQAVQAVADGRRRRARLRRLDRRRAGRRAVPHQARAGRPPPGAGAARAGARRARSCCSTPAPTSRCAPSTSSSSPTWARRSGGRARRRAPARGAALQRRGADEGHRDVVAAHARSPRGRRRCDFVGNVEGFAIGDRRGRRDRHRRLHRQRRAQGDGGDVGGAARRDPRRGDVHRALEGSAGCCCARRCGGLRDELDPEEPGGAFLLGLRGLGVVPHGSFGARGIAARDRSSPRAACASDVVGRTHARSRRPARCGAAPSVRGGR